MQNFMFLAFGLGALLVAAALFLLLLRLNRTLFVVEALVEILTDEMRQTLPEVRQGLGSVNEIASGMNVALQQAGSGIGVVGERLRRVLRVTAVDASAAVYGMRVAGRTLAEAYAQQDMAHSGGVDVSNVTKGVRKEDVDGE